MSQTCPICGDVTQLKQRNTAAGFRTVTCSQCGLEHMSPRPSSAELEQIYVESYYDSWNLKAHEDAVRRLKRRTGLGHLHRLEPFATPPGKILDVGCATGFFLEVAREIGWDPYGVEVSAYAARSAEDRIGPGRIHQGLLETAPFEPETFDIITMMDCIEHVLDLKKVMSAVNRLLTPRGFLVITTPYAGSFTYKLMGSNWTHYKLEHLQYFDKRSMKHLLSHFGFETLLLSGAEKHISMDYFVQQFNHYRHPVITPISNVISKLVPRALQHTTVRLLLGDMFVIAGKRTTVDAG